MKGCDVFTRYEPSSSFACWKLVATVDCPFEILAKYCNHSTAVGEMDHTTGFAAQIKQYESGNIISYAVAIPGFPFSYRKLFIY